MSTENDELLVWRDLSSEDVYHIAHLENKARDMFAVQVGKITFGTDPLASPEAISASKIATDHETHAQNWLANQAIVLDKTVESRQTDIKTDIQKPRGLVGSRNTRLKGATRPPKTGGRTRSEPNDSWIRKNRLAIDHLSQKGFGEALGISQTTVSQYECEVLEPTPEMARRIANFFANAKELEGEDRELFISEACTSILGEQSTN